MTAYDCVWQNMIVYDCIWLCITAPSVISLCITLRINVKHTKRAVKNFISSQILQICHISQPFSAQMVISTGVSENIFTASFSQKLFRNMGNYQGYKTPDPFHHSSPRHKRTLQLKLGILGDECTLFQYHNCYNHVNPIKIDRIHTISKFIHLDNATVELTISGAKPSPESISIICNKANAVVFTFDLMNKSTLSSIFSHYQTARQQNKVWLYYFV